jgi:coenzyme Q-binding protein COQ10
MPSHQSTELSPYSTEQLFALVADVKRYPEFLPWCRAARILSEEGNEILAELVISFAHLTESYTSRVVLTPPMHPQGEARIDVAMVKGPFSHLTNHWHFIPLPDGGTRIELELDFKFKSRLLESLIGGIFERATLKMTTAFKERAAALYGNATA